jgi:hypothetical protein
MEPIPKTTKIVVFFTAVIFLLKGVKYGVQICTRLKSAGIDSEESIPPAYLCSLSLAGRYDNPYSYSVPLFQNSSTGYIGWGNPFSGIDYWAP